jgi:NAD(P)-dependent dehydrogenase (short-subunit alcohol dehydrogenase family)
MTDRLAGKTALITGGASGIGHASAGLYAGEGARVVICDINEDAGNAAVDELEAAGAAAWFRPMDVTDESSVEAVFRDVVAGIGPIDVLYNCAGGSTNDDAAVHSLETSVISHVFRLELMSAMLCSKQAVPIMKENGGGVIINMSSFVAFRGVFDIHAYTAAKGGLVSLTRAMAGSYARDGIRVNAIAPGVALTERAAARMQASNIASVMPFDWEDYPFGLGRPEDIAHIAVFLASDESRMINGQTIAADGGLGAY